MRNIAILLLLPLVLLPATTGAVAQVDINTASLGQLDLLAGIGPTLAQRIIDGRPYASINDLRRVKGIGEKTLQKIKDQGLAYVQARAAAKPIESLPKVEKSGNTVSVATAAASEPLQKNASQNPWMLFIAALAITITAGIATILLKIYFHHVRS